VQIKSYAWNIVILHEGKIIGEHPRSFKRHQKVYNPWHYVSALERKPGALRNGAPFKELMSLLPKVFSRIRDKLSSYKDGDKQFITIMLLASKLGLERVTNACNLSLNAGGCSAKLVEQYLEPAEATAVSTNASHESDASTFIQLKDPPNADCSIYSKLYLKWWSN